MVTISSSHPNLRSWPLAPKTLGSVVIAAPTHRSAGVVPGRLVAPHDFIGENPLKDAHLSW